MMIFSCLRSVLQVERGGSLADSTRPKAGRRGRQAGARRDEPVPEVTLDHHRQFEGRYDGLECVFYPKEKLPMATTHIAIHEYGCTTKSYVLNSLVPKSPSIWEDCLNAISLAALQGFKCGQHPIGAIRRPNAWSNPANNIGNQAAGKAWNNTLKANPHVHGGVGIDHRAAIGCTATANAAGTHWQFMKIYIGQFS